MATNQPYGHAVPLHPPQGNGLAVTAMVLGIISVVLCWVWFLGGVLALLAIVFGALGMGRAKRANGAGKGAAVAGLVLGVVGLLLAIIFVIVAVIAIGAFTEYAKKSKASGGEIHLRMMEKRIKVFHLEHARLPVSAGPTPSGTGCGTPDGKFPMQPASVWRSDPGWAEIDFAVDEPGYYQFQWVQESPTKGHALAISDLDCDGTPGTQRLDIEVIEGNVTATYGPPSTE